MTGDRLRALIEAELARECSPEAQAMAAHLATRPGVAAVLFYGARLRGAPDATGGGGPLDFYVLTDGDRAYHGPGLAALANRLLPPNVYYETILVSPRLHANAPAPEPGPGAEGALRTGAPAQARDIGNGSARIEAKVAVATLAAFRARMRPQALDTSFWARFAQPVALVWARSPADRSAAIDAVAAAVETAAWWAVRLAPEPAQGADIWRALFRHTYGSELRVEGGGRADAIVATAPQRYADLAEMLFAPVSQTERNAARRGWALRRVLGKLRNLARLIKAAFTYRGGLAYALGKVERHSGRPVELKPWQRRWPWLAAPLVLWRLWREGRLR